MPHSDDTGNGAGGVSSTVDEGPVRPFERDIECGIRMLADSAECVAFIDEKSRIHYLNAAGAELLEIDAASSVVGQEWGALWPPQDRGAAETALAEAQKGKVSRFSGRCPTAKGGQKWWEVVISPFHGADRRVRWYLVIAHDITSHRAFEDRLLVSEQRFRALADNMDQLAWMADPAGNIFWFNQRWFEYTGSTLDEMAGRGWWKAMHPDHSDRVVAKLAANLSSGAEWEDTFPLRRSDGHFRWFLSRARPLRDDSGRVMLWCGTNTDISDQRNASSRLRQKARLVELSHEAILVWDFNEGILSWNKGCEELYGYARDEVLGRSTHDLLKTRYPSSSIEFLAELKRVGSWTGELLQTTRQGAHVWVDSRHELLRVDGRDVVLETNRDVTGRRQAEEIRTLLVGELNHRVKNTLAIVQSIAAQTARSSRDLKQFTASFNDRLQSLSATQNVLTETNWSGADLNQLIESQLAHDGGATSPITYSGPAVFLPAQSAMQLSLILHELAINARKHGSLSVPRGRVLLSWQLLPGPPRTLHLLWREVDGPPVAKPAMRGFGMTLIERAGNQPHLQAALTFEPTGLVCTIVVHVPEVPVHTPQYFNPGRPVRVGHVNADRQQPIPYRAKRVLVVEDEPLIAMDIEEILSDSGFAVVGPAASVASALEAMAASEFDMALVDGNLLGKPVDSVIEELVRLQKPFAFVTGFTKEGLPKGYENAPVVKKPVHADTLVNVLNSLCPD